MPRRGKSSGFRSLNFNTVEGFPKNAPIHKDLADRMSFLDSQLASYRSAVGDSMQQEMGESVAKYMRALGDDFTAFGQINDDETTIAVAMSEYEDFRNGRFGLVRKGRGTIADFLGYSGLGTVGSSQGGVQGEIKASQLGKPLDQGYDSETGE